MIGKVIYNTSEVYCPPMHFILEEQFGDYFDTISQASILWLPIFGDQRQKPVQHDYD